MSRSLLPVNEVIEAAELARARVGYSRKAFLYFCKACWNKIRAYEG